MATTKPNQKENTNTLTPEEYRQQKKKLGLPENALDELLSSLKPHVKVVYYRNKKK